MDDGDLTSFESGLVVHLMAAKPERCSVQTEEKREEKRTAVEEI